MAREAGFRMGLTLQRKIVGGTSDPMRLGRFLVNQKDIASDAGRFSSSLFEYETSMLVLHAKRFVRSVVTALKWGKTVRSEYFS